MDAKPPSQPAALALTCPSCGAPLHAAPGDVLVICMYCNTTSRVQAGAALPGAAAQPEVTAETTLSAEDMAVVRQHLIEARKDDALKLYREKSGASEAEAHQALDGVSRQLSLDIIRSQLLNGYGMLLVIISLLIVVASAAAGLTGRLPFLWALVLMMFGSWQLYYFALSIRTTLQFWGAKVAPAVTLKLAPVGIFKMGRRDVHTLKVLLEVQPPDEASFRAELLLPVHAENIERAKPGAVLRVKYLPGNPPKVVYMDRKTANEQTNDG